MGKEIRVGLSVVGVLLLLFCGLLYARVVGSGLALPEVSLSATPRLITDPPRVHVQPTIVQRSGTWDELVTPLASNPTAAAPPQTVAEHAESFARRAANPYRVGDVELTSAEGAADDELTNPRATNIAASSAMERTYATAGGFAGEASGRSILVAGVTELGPDTIRLAVGEEETLTQLAVRAYGDAQYEPALAQLLRDTGTARLRAGATLEVPATSELRARYPHLVP